MLPAFGTKYLIFTRFPDGYPVRDIKPEEAEELITLSNPGVPLTKEMYTFGRGKWNGRDVGVVLYPLNEVVRRELQTIKSNPYIDGARLENEINHRFPDWIAQDQGEVMVFDRSLDRFITQPNIELSKGTFSSASWQSLAEPEPETDETVTEALSPPTQTPTAPPPLAVALHPLLTSPPVWVRSGDALPENPFVWHSKAPPFAVHHAPQ
jgi:hypothetical protein